MVEFSALLLLLLLRGSRLSKLFMLDLRAVVEVVVVVLLRENCWNTKNFCCIFGLSEVVFQGGFFGFLLQIKDLPNHMLAEKEKDIF